jgi:hypothetical protein
MEEMVNRAEPKTGARGRDVLYTHYVYLYLAEDRMDEHHHL